MTFVPWKQGKYLVWDATCVDTFCQSHCPRAVTEPGGAAAHAEEEKIKKYAHLDSIYIFQSVAIETCGSIGSVSKSFLRDLSNAATIRGRHLLISGFFECGYYLGVATI